MRITNQAFTSHWSLATAFKLFTKHETRDPRHGDSLARGASQREFRGFHETRITKHETRLFSRDSGLLFPFLGD